MLNVDRDVELLEIPQRLVAVVSPGWKVGVAVLGAGNKGVSTLSADNLKTIIKLTLSQSAFYYQHMPAILNNISDKTLLPEKYFLLV